MKNLTKNDDVKKEAMRKVSVLLKELIGDRSIRRTAEDTGVAASYITEILKERYLPSADILRKLAAPEAKPQNGVSLEDLMLAAGYATRYQDDYIDEAVQITIDEIIDKVELSEKVKNRISHYMGRDLIKAPNRDRHNEIIQERQKYESLVTGILYKTLMELGIRFNVDNSTIGVRGFKPDMAIHIPKQPILEWWFDFKYISNNIGNASYLSSSVIRLLERYIFIEPKLERKISIVINDKNVFEAIRGYKDKLSYRGDLSVILVNEETFRIEKEVYIAHYKEKDYKSEFYIV